MPLGIIVSASIVRIAPYGPPRSAAIGYGSPAWTVTFFSVPVNLNGGL